MNIKYDVFTDKGDREINEDSCIALQNQNNEFCFVVADGLGGHGFGEVASQSAVETFKASFNEAEEIKTEEFLSETFSKAQDDIMKLQNERRDKNGIKTTCVALLVNEKEVQWAHVGDSRLYAFKKNKAKLRTLDHSVPQMLALSKEIKEKQIRKHPDRNRLLRVMGITWDRPQYELSDKYAVKEYNVFLLCTDGFWELIDEKAMGKLLKKSETPNEWLKAMAKVVAENGKNDDMDNYTAIAVFID